MKLFNYDSTNENAVHYGNYYWGVELPDGRFISLHAKNINVVDGALIASRVLEDGSSQSLLSIAAGHWVTYYAANILTGAPVCVDKTEKVEETTYELAKRLAEQQWAEQNISA
jgi:hypothetical protein